MGLFSWKKNRIIDSFATALANELYSNVEPELAEHFIEKRIAEKKKEARVRHWVNSVGAEMRKFAGANGLGIYGKARMHQQFGNRLVVLGYDAAVAKDLVRRLLF